MEVAAVVASFSSVTAVCDLGRYLHCSIASAAGSENVKPGACNDGRTAAALQRQSAPQLLKTKDELACKVNNKKRDWRAFLFPSK